MSGKHLLRPAGNARYLCLDCPFEVQLLAQGQQVINKGDTSVRHAPHSRVKPVPFNLGP